MKGWADDPELVATFRAEVNERIASLCEGLLRLERDPSPKRNIAALFRDAHTVKGSARMLGLDGVVDIAHRMEDVLGALRDGRRAANKDLIDVLLVSAESISRSLPGAELPLTVDELAEIVAALDGAVAGDEPMVVPRLRSADLDDSDEAGRPRGGDSVRVPTRRVHDLLDMVGEAELDLRRISTHSRELTTLTADPPALGTRAARRGFHGHGGGGKHAAGGCRRGARPRLPRGPAGGCRSRALRPDRGRRRSSGQRPRRSHGPGDGAGAPGRGGLPPADP